MVHTLSAPDYKPGDMKILLKILEYRKKELEEHIPRDPFTFYVTDLVRCSLKRQYEINHPELLYIRIISGRTFMGDMVHKGLEAVLKTLFGDSIKTENTDDTTAFKEIVVDGQKYIVKGRIDAILNNNIGVEIKETISKGKLPYPHHVEQCMIYNWLYGFEKTILIYITPEGIFEYEIPNSMSDAEIINRIKQVKAPRYDWECDLCEFRNICSVAKMNYGRNQNQK